MIRRIVLSILLTAALLGASAGVFWLLVKTRARPPLIEPEQPPLAVKVVRLTPQTVVVPIEGFGTARADRVATVAAEVSGAVIERPTAIRSGAFVRTGQLLVQIDEREYQAQVQRARSQLTAERAVLAQLDVREHNLERLIATATEELQLTEREYARTLDLFERQMSNERELDAAKLALKRARRSLQALENELALLPQQRKQQQAIVERHEAELLLAELNVERCTIRAPFDASVDAIDVELGERVNPGQALLTLVDPDLIEVPIELPISRRNEIRNDATAQLMIESDPVATWRGHVARIAPRADATTRTFALYVEVDNTMQDTPLMPGMFVQARVSGPALADALIVPRGAVRDGGVFIARDGQARRAPVELRARLQDQAIITGVAPGALVITSNLDALHDGTPVMPSEESVPAAPEIAADAVSGTGASANSPTATP